MRILIVEKSPTDRRLLRYLLEDRFQSEAKFREADSLETAFKYLEMRNIDCVVLDLLLPEAPGKAGFEKISKRHPKVPIIVMTHSSDRALALALVRSGATDYVLKDATEPEEIFERIIKAVHPAASTGRVAAVYPLKRPPTVSKEEEDTLPPPPRASREPPPKLLDEPTATPTEENRESLVEAIHRLEAQFQTFSDETTKRFNEVQIRNKPTSLPPPPPRTMTRIVILALALLLAVIVAAVVVGLKL